jgi:hypothetical protein
MRKLIIICCAIFATCAAFASISAFAEMRVGSQTVGLQSSIDNAGASDLPCNTLAAPGLNQNVKLGILRPPLRICR